MNYVGKFSHNFQKIKDFIIFNPKERNLSIKEVSNKLIGIKTKEYLLSMKGLKNEKTRSYLLIHIVKKIR